MAGLAVVVFVAWFLGRPIVRDRPAASAAPDAPPPGPSASAPPPSVAVGARQEAELGRELLLRQLSELEYDYRMGKLTREDYLQQRAALTGRNPA